MKQALVICLLFVFVLFNLRNMFLQATAQFASAEHDAVFAGQANQPDIRPEPHHLPLKATAGVLLAQRHSISKLNLRQHSRIITLACYNPAIAKGTLTGILEQV